MQLLLGWLPVPCLSADPPEPKVDHSPGRCIWYGQCAPGTYGTLNCYYNGAPKSIGNQSKAFVDLLTKTCPNLVKENRGVCCDMKQLNTLATQIKVAQELFVRCPACLRNFVDHFCLTTCDPDGAAWMNPTLGHYNNITKQWSVDSVDIYITLDYAEDLYDSCKNVQQTQASTKVVDVMCGTTECNATKWLSYLGDPVANHESPFPMNYYYYGIKSENVTAKTYEYMTCNTSDPEYQCSCSDCPAANICPPPPEPIPDNFPYFEVTVCIVAVGCGLSVLLFIVAMIAAIISMRSKSGYTRIDSSGGDGRPSSRYGTIEDDNDSPTSSVGSINADDNPATPPSSDRVDGGESAHPAACWFRLGLWIEYGIKWAFYHWGKFVAQYWYIVFFFVGLVVIALSCGLFFFHITTTPVDLWTSPTSRAREEKVYFDTHFSPFYRTEMIIVTAPKLKRFYYQPAGVVSGANWTIGPVLRREVLTEVGGRYSSLA